MRVKELDLGDKSGLLPSLGPDGNSSGNHLSMHAIRRHPHAARVTVAVLCVCVSVASRTTTRLTVHANGLSIVFAAELMASFL